jgi:hypothetical protein
MSISEYDSRQITKMKSQLSSYLAGSLELGELVDDLVFLRDTLENCSADWDLRFTEKLTDLESVNSYMIEKDINILDATIQPIIDLAIPAIDELINNLT